MIYFLGLGLLIVACALFMWWAVVSERRHRERLARMYVERSKRFR